MYLFKMEGNTHVQIKLVLDIDVNSYLKRGAIGTYYTDGIMGLQVYKDNSLNKHYLYCLNKIPT